MIALEGMLRPFYHDCFISSFHLVYLSLSPEFWGLGVRMGGGSGKGVLGGRELYPHVFIGAIEPEIQRSWLFRYRGVSLCHYSPGNGSYNLQGWLQLLRTEVLLAVRCLSGVHQVFLLHIRWWSC